MRKNETKKTSAGAGKIRQMALIAMLGAIATILMLFEVPLPFLAPPFYELDLSEVPILIGAFALGPVAGVLIELLKVLLNLLINGTITAGVGEFANFLIGCSFLLPASLIYHRKKDKKHAMIGMAAGTIFMAATGCIINAYILLPAYSAGLGIPMDTLVGMGTAINPAINSIMTFVVLAVAPFNLVKGVVVSVLTFLLYKRISGLIKAHH